MLSFVTKYRFQAVRVKVAVTSVRKSAAFFPARSLSSLLLVLFAVTAYCAVEPSNAKELVVKKTEKTWNHDADAKRMAAMSPEELAWEKVLEANLGSFYLPLYKDDKLKKKITAWDFVKDDPKLPRVLLIGDSISRGYTLAVRQALAGKVNVHRAPENCGPTANGVKKLDIWLGDGKWDLIHFNFGIHDRKTPAQEYEQRLETITQRLKATRAKLIWASSTPLPAKSQYGDDSAIVKCNEIAARLMHKQNVPINDLYTFIQPHLEKFQNTNDVHFKSEGYDYLGKKVAAEILAVLDVKRSVQTTDTWHGFTRHKLPVDGCLAWIVEPKTPAAGKPWTWCMEFPDAFTERTGVVQLLAQGFHHVHIQVSNTFGCPAALKHFDAFYQTLQSRGLATKGTLIGISRGGLYAYNWAARNSDKVACIYGDAPVCDFKSWPAGRGKGKGSPKDWQALIKCYEFASEAEALAWKENPVDNLAALARAKIPLIHVVGDVDDVVPFAENTALVEQRYRELGGTMTVLHKPNVGHHPHGLDDPAPLVDFILRSSKVKN